MIYFDIFKECGRITGFITFVTFLPDIVFITGPNHVTGWKCAFFAERWWHHAKSPFPSWTTTGTTQMPCFRTHYTSINAIGWGGFDCDCADSIAEKHSLLQPVIQADHSPALNLPLLLPSCPHVPCDSPQHISAVILYKWNYFVHEVFYHFYSYKLAVDNDIMGLN